MMKRSVLVLLLLQFSLAVYCQEYVNLEVFNSASISNMSSLNTKANEFSPSIAYPKVYFVSDGKPNGRQLSSFDIFYFNSKDSIPQRSKLSSKLSTRYQEGPASPIKGRNQILFSRSSLLDSSSTNLSRLYVYDFLYDNIQNISLPVTKSENICHPALNSTQNQIIYVSDSKGNLDLTLSNKKSGQWSIALAISSINSEVSDAFPNFITDNTLVFASNRPGGYGGFDLYITQFASGQWSRPLLLPPPFNSDGDDFGFVIEQSKYMMGYFSSNRLGGKGGDDIYSFSLSTPLVTKVKPTIFLPLTIQSLDKLGFDAIADVSIRVYSLDDTASINIIKRGNINVFNMNNTRTIMDIVPSLASKATSYVTNLQGAVKLQVESGIPILIEALKSGYQNQVVFLEKLDVNQTSVTLALTPLATDAEYLENSGMKLGDIFTFTTSYFEGKTPFIKKEVFEDLDLLLIEMLENENLAVRIINHTDSRGNSSQNKKLTIDRAIALKKYLVAKGVKEANIEAIGAGDFEILNKCKKGVNCTDAEHEINIRTVIIVKRV